MGAMRLRAEDFAARFLPGGWRDLGRQIVLFCGAYYLYRIVRGVVDGRAAEAYANAREIISLEQEMNLFFEPAAHAWASGSAWVIDAASWMYVNSHFTITVLTLAWIYLWRNAAFYFVRNMFMAAMGMALILYVAYPTAPPRLMPEWGFTDPVAGLTGTAAQSGVSELLVNPFAAVPSMHVCFALMLAIPMAQIVRRRWAATLWLGYPAVVSFVVVVTANHWWIDAALGAVVALAAATLAVMLVRAAPNAWAFRTQPQGTAA